MNFVVTAVGIFMAIKLGKIIRTWPAREERVAFTGHWHLLAGIIATILLLVPVKPIFQVLVFVSLAAGLFGVYSIVRLTRGRSGAFQQTLLFLIVGFVASSIQFYYSLTLHGSTAHNNMRLYLTGIMLLALFLLRLPGIWERSGLGGSAGPGNLRGSGGPALFLCGLFVITTPVWAAPTHVIDGWNTVTVLLWLLMGTGALLMMLGGWKWTGGTYTRREKQTAASLRKSSDA